MDKEQLEVKSYNVEDERRFKDLTARVVSLEYWRGAAQADMVKRLVALEARCHELKVVPEQIADLQQRVKAVLENERGGDAPSELVYSYDSEPEPEQMWACELAETCIQAQCQSRTPHPLRDNCKQPCCSQPHDGGRCQPVPTPAAPVMADDEAMAAFQEKLMDGMVRAGAIPVELSSPSKPAPELVRCEVVGCTHTSCGHLAAHWTEPLCSLGCTRFKSVRCIPVPAQEPEAAIPDVPAAVGTEAFRRNLTHHLQELGANCLFMASLEHIELAHIESLEHLAGVACTLRDAYDLARVGEHEAAQEKLEEIEW